MKWLKGNWEKFIFALLVCLAPVLFALSAGALETHRRLLEQKIEILAGQEAQVSAEESRAKFEKLLPPPGEEDKEITLAALTRNIFEPLREETVSEDDVYAFVSGEPVFELLEIGYKPLGIDYQGRLVYDDGSIVAQINIGPDTYLIKPGMKVGEFKTVEINKQQVVLQEGKSPPVTLKFRETTYTKELEAKIKELNSQKVVAVTAGSEMFGARVIDITKDAVIILSRGQRLELTKGTVQK